MWIRSSFPSSRASRYLMTLLPLCCQSKKVQNNLQIMVLSALLCSTLRKFRGQELHAVNIFKGIGLFLGVFWASTFIGILFGVVVALMLKYSQLSRFSSIESCLVLLMAYSSYFFSNGTQMSGIVTLLFTGITLKHYAYDNLSTRSKRATKFMFQILSQLSENFIFIYLGINLFTQDDLDYKPLFILATLVCCIARLCRIKKKD